MLSRRAECESLAPNAHAVCVCLRHQRRKGPNGVKQTTLRFTEAYHDAVYTATSCNRILLLREFNSNPQEDIDNTLHHGTPIASMANDEYDVRLPIRDHNHKHEQPN